MSASIKITKNVSGLVSASEVVTQSDVQGLLANPTVIKAQPAVLTTRTNNTAGTLTMNNNSHGITTGQRVDLYWSGGQCYGAIVGTVAGTSVPIASVSGGSVLPSTSTNISVGIATSAPFNCTGNNIQALVLSTPQTGYFVFNNGSTDVYAALVQGGNIYTWDVSESYTNPLASQVPTKVYMSHTNLTGSISLMNAQAVTH